MQKNTNQKKVKQQQWSQQNKSTSTVEKKENLDKLLPTVPSFYLFKFAVVTKKMLSFFLVFIDQQLTSQREVLKDINCVKQSKVKQAIY